MTSTGQAATGNSRSRRSSTVRPVAPGEPGTFRDRVPPDACRADFPVLKKVLLDLGVPRTGMGYVEPDDVKNRLTSLGLKHARIAETLLAARLVGAMVCYDERPGRTSEGAGLFGEDLGQTLGSQGLRSTRSEHGDAAGRGQTLDDVHHGPYEVRLSALLVD